ncbi:small nuclear ribonucleoprotein F, putative [Perkinsus marinus ATCC 50983]|uniref:Sm protein F n=1 Tax=Perkinsus marinus (strain ATCC 50983 / TXsc) TaxID=423536 RepID=C5KPX6_PERM5|nr:small nuclear ribonucleoprotein F, putative [Perkinsus marinus ATCC 50983]EER13523.1 small nuclear ribonucleoprotein F, putative [Perkinsus marinus ATCC 50983]|eukprot:XP_002781728.1 small nuclear ribonucleoprotein F, putative [Perkinsus marinus ATCC 50983]
MSVVPVNPQPFLNDLTGQEVLVRLKWGTLELKGRLQSVDTFMNLRLDHCEEWQAGNFKGALGDVLIRCNNVLYVRAASSSGAGEELED